MKTTTPPADSAENEMLERAREFKRRQAANIPMEADAYTLKCSDLAAFAAAETAELRRERDDLKQRLGAAVEANDLLLIAKDTESFSNAMIAAREFRRQYPKAAEEVDNG